MAEEPQTL